MDSVNQSYRYDEEALIGLASKGDLDAFNQLVLTYQDMAYRHAYSLLGDPEAAEDTTQDSFIKAFEGIRSFRGGSFRSWLLRIVSNTAYDVLRQSKRRPTQPLYPEGDDGEEIESPAWLADPNVSVQGAVEQSEEAKYIYRALDELPDVHRSILTLVDLYDLDYSEAARVLKVPIGTVKSRLARARLQMKAKLLSEEYAILPILSSVRNTG
ncbi:MAG: RNA polymerase sigma factor [Chloroflexi bacterium]|nr:RNA polymerase sigma factor [Chloroflexota bacterium]